MVNQLVLVINVISVLLVDTFFLADLNISQNIPPSLAPGSETRVTVTVDKGTLTGFAKLQIDLPPGLSATAIETKGASFTYADGKAKFIWMALPASPSFKVTYTLTADATVNGVQHINGRLSYIEDNERKTHDMSTSVVDFGAPGTVPVATTEVVPEEEVNNDLVSAAGGAPTGTTPIAVIDNAGGTAPMQGAGGVGGSRTITPVNEKEMLVEVIVRKGDIRGFGKLQEVVPQGFTALEKSSSEAIFTVQDRIVKFVWLNLPATSEIKVVYKLRANERPEGEYTIDGEFGYLLNDETQKAVVGSSKFFIGPKALEVLAQMQQANEPEKHPGGADPIAVVTPPVKHDAPPVKEKEQERTTTAHGTHDGATAGGATARGTTDRIPAPEKGVTYKVQITAAHREVGKSYFKARHSYSGDFQIERHEGWIKYVTGGYTDYKSARDQRVDYVSAGHNFPGPFVTAYNNGSRITVQEALVLAGQQWVQ